MLKSNLRRMNFEDNTFDTVVDTFGLEFYVNPRAAIREMKRVCKNNGLILILANGIPDNKSSIDFAKMQQAENIVEWGHYSGRNWDKVLESFKFEIIQRKKFNNGSLYFYILKNQK